MLDIVRDIPDSTEVALELLDTVSKDKLKEFGENAFEVFKIEKTYKMEGLHNIEQVHLVRSILKKKGYSFVMINNNSLEISCI